MDKPNILFYFTDQQRWDTLGCCGQPLPVTPNLDRLAQEGVVFEEAYTPQPVCGPCRAIFQTGRYPTQTGCFKNGISLPAEVKTVADYMYEVPYDCAYVGKWHLASDEGQDGAGQGRGTPADYTTGPVPPDRRGGYRGFWRVSDVLEFTSHGYDGYVFDEDMNRCDFKGYRVDRITDFAMEYLDRYDTRQPFFLTVSHIEPHHQNDRKHYEGPKGSKERFKNFVLPGDLQALSGNAAEEYADYLGCCKSLDDNLGRLTEKLKEKGLYDNTVIVYASDHGSHFRTRNKDAHLNGGDDYKRSCHSACLHVPLVIAGPGFRGGRRVRELVSTVSLPKTFLSLAGIKAGESMAGEDLREVADGRIKDRENIIFSQISESRVGRCVRTPDWLYSVYAPGKNGFDSAESDVYAADFLYDLKNDPFELYNLAEDERYRDVRRDMGRRLIREMRKAGEREPAIRD